MRRTKTKKGTMYVHPATIALLKDATWKFAQSILGKEQSFTEAETELCKFLIQQYYEAIPAERFSETVSQQYLSYCEKILFVKKYTSRFPNRHVPHPTVWLNRHYTKGFSGAKVWYDTLEFEKCYRVKVREINLDSISGAGFPAIC
jgi:hypothetical protein